MRKELEKLLARTDWQINSLERTFNQEMESMKERQKLGIQVKKGEHATVCTKLWKPKAKKYTDTNGEEKIENNFFLTKAYLFKLNQVERIAPTN